MQGHWAQNYVQSPSCDLQLQVCPQKDAFFFWCSSARRLQQPPRGSHEHAGTMGPELCTVSIL